ncbi:MAG TPA: carboxypeptidase-like regulatory domain-containing protein [Candidatus Aquilonibacter sp.]|nr:carboxypeptidase-like regulatory domain-containing protein [Candidatus Aquilonibacter sp.]
MRALALTVGILACAAIPAFAQTPTGISGYVIDADTHHPIPGAEVAVYRMPMSNASLAVRTLRTNQHGFFSKILLEPGHYVLMASANGLRAACETSDLVSGAVTHINVQMSRTHEVCVGKHVQSALVVPGQTTDVYVVH